MAATSRKPYQSDLTEEQWAILQPLNSTCEARRTPT